MAQSDDSPLSLTLRTKLDKAEEELKNKDQELGELKKQLWEKEDKLREKTEELNTELKENKRLKEELREFKETKKELEEKKEEIELLKGDNEDLKNKCSEYESEYSSLNDDILQEYTKVLLRNEFLNDENEEQARHNYELKEELKRLRTEMESQALGQDQFDSSPSRPDELHLNRISSTNTEDTMSPTSGQVMMRRMSSASSGHSTFVAPPTEFNLKSLMNLLGKAAYLWNQIGIQLEIYSGTLQSIKNENNTDMDRLSATLGVWIANETLPCNYDTIYDILRSPPVNRSDLIPSDFR